MVGIYCIQNKTNNKRYIGQTTKDIEERWKQHIKELNGNYHGNRHLQLSWNKYGQNNFNFIVVEECLLDSINDREQYWIDFYDTVNGDNGYNMCGVKPKSTMREETRKKLSDTKKGENNPMYGLPGTRIGVQHTDKTRKKISENKKGKNYGMTGENHPTFGKKLSEEHKQKIKENHPRLNGEQHSQVQITEETAIQIIDLLLKGERVYKIAENLEISRNIVYCIKYKHSWSHLTENIDFSSARTIITDAIALEIIQRLNFGEKPIDIADDLGISKRVIYHIKKKNTWKHVWEQYYNQLKDAI